MSSWVEKNRRPKNEGNLTLDRAGALNVIRTEAQVRPHDGFKQSAVHVNYPVRQETSGERTMLMAVPPGWTETDLPCIPQGRGRLARAHMDRWDTDNELVAGVLCVDCPVSGLCLGAAIAEEHGLSAGNRYMVRGGVTPQGRVRLEAQNEGLGELA